MSEAMQLLNSLNLDDYVDPTPVNDFLIIDPTYRTITIPKTELLFGVITDHGVERKYFKCPRIVGDNIDLSQLSLRIPFTNANKEKDLYIVDDVVVDGDYITFSWLLSDKVLMYKGDVQFAVAAVKSLSDGIVQNLWNTTYATGHVLDGMPAIDDNYIDIEKVPDVLGQVLNIYEDTLDEIIAIQKTLIGGDV